MNIRLITVGKPREPELRSLIEEYHRRIGRWARLAWRIVPEVPYQSGQARVARNREGERLLAAVEPGDYLVLLTPAGEMVDSVSWARQLQQWRDQNLRVVLMVGGSLGVSDAVVARAQWQWSLSPLVFPHGIAQLLLAEQLYRGLTILAHHPYHKG